MKERMKGPFPSSRRAMKQRKQAKARDVYWHMPSKVTKVGDGSTSPRDIASKALRVMERLAKSESLAEEQSREELVHVKVREWRGGGESEGSPKWSGRRAIWTLFGGVGLGEFFWVRD